MKKALLAGALIAATLAPVAAQAQDYHRDHREQQDRRDLRDDRRDLREDRRDQRDDHRNMRHDRRDYGRDRGDYRGDYRGNPRSNWRAPFAYRSFGIGAVVPRGYWGSSYYANDWQRFRVPAPRYGFYRYVRHYGDLLLINTRNGRVVQVYRGYYR